MKISEAFDAYRDQYMILKYQSVRMVETHEQVKRSVIGVIGDKNIEKFSLEDLSRWCRKISVGRCQNTVRNYVARIKGVLKFMDLKGYKVLKPALVAVPKRMDTQVEFLDREEVNRMIRRAYSVRNQFIISLLFSSGIRLSELINLDRGQIRDGRFTVIGKGGKARLCFVDERTEDLMAQYMAERTDSSRALVISVLNKDRMTASNVQLLIKNSAERAGITRHVTPHTLRHSFATDFLKNGGDVRYLQTLLGHSSLNTTMKYTHVMDMDLEEKYRKFHKV